MTPTSGRTKKGKNEKQKLKSAGLEVPREIGRVVFVSRYSPYLFKKILYLKSFYGVVFITIIALISWLVYLHCTSESWKVDELLGILSLYVFAIIVFEELIFRKTVVNVVGMYGFTVYEIRFSAKSTHKKTVLYRDIYKVRYYQGGDEWWKRGNNTYYSYTLIRKNNDTTNMTIYSSTRTNDELNFMIHVLKNWLKTVVSSHHAAIHQLIDGLEQLKY